MKLFALRLVPVSRSVAGANFAKGVDIMLSFFKRLTIITAFASASVTAFADAVPDYAGKHRATAEDITVIEAAIEEFARAIREKDGAALQALFLYDDIFFHPAPRQEAIDQVRQQDPDFFKKHPSGRAQGFVKFISESKEQLEERFYNVKVIQDTEFALVTFDYDFRINGVVSNYGFEVWQMFKVDGKWKIATVAWSSTNTGN